MPEEKRPEKIYSVSELNTLSQRALEEKVGEIWVRGEISGLKTQSSGHIYFNLKDEKSLLSVALFRNSALKTSVRIEEGKQILAYGEVGIYSPSGRYQMVARMLLEEGAGKLQQEFERLKKKLEEEGLFSRERKVPVPLLPRTVAFITSPTGAVWQDFTKILSRRDWRGKVILFPCRVQGAEAPAEIIDCLKRADSWPELELIVVGRGGGSLEDLWAFNDERVVRAVAAVIKPVISAIGHETDFTLCDFASDFRAETPSAAAELIAGHFNDSRMTVKDLERHLLQILKRHAMIFGHRIDGLKARLLGRSPRVMIERYTQRLDEFSERISGSFAHKIAGCRERIATFAAHLNGMDPATALRRGYAMIRDENGKLVTRAAKTRQGQKVELEFSDGGKKAVIG